MAQLCLDLNIKSPIKWQIITKNNIICALFICHPPTKLSHRTQTVALKHMSYLVLLFASISTNYNKWRNILVKIVQILHGFWHDFYGTKHVQYLICFRLDSSQTLNEYFMYVLSSDRLFCSC